MKKIILLLVVVVVVGMLGGMWLVNKPTETQQATGDLKEQVVMGTGGEYVNYAEQVLADNGGKRKVLFFHAGWCPTCKAAEQEILANLDQLPEDVVIIKTDYDTQDALKKKYQITYQHTFVWVDDAGMEIRKWNGGGVEEILQRLEE